MKVAMVFDAGDGRVAVVFANQPAMEAWLDQHPDADEAGQGMIPITTASALLNDLKKGGRS